MIGNKVKKALSGAKDVLVGTLRNMSPAATEARMREADRLKQEETLRMIRENFGSEENYRKTLGLDTPEGRELFDPPYAKVMRPFVERLTKARNAVSGVKK